VKAVRVYQQTNWTPATQTFDIDAIGARGVIVDWMRENWTALVIDELRPDLSFGGELVRITRSATNDQPGPLFGIPVGGAQVRLTMTGLTTPNACRLTFVDEPVKFGSLMLAEFQGVIGAGGNSPVLALTMFSRLLRQYWVCCNGNHQYHVDVKARGASLQYGTVITGTQAAVTGGGVQLGPLPNYYQIACTLVNDDGGNANNMSFALYGDL
jgi:hypothetical protein